MMTVQKLSRQSRTMTTIRTKATTLLRHNEDHDQYHARHDDHSVLGRLEHPGELGDELHSGVADADILEILGVLVSSLTSK